MLFILSFLKKKNVIIIAIITMILIVLIIGISGFGLRYRQPIKIIVTDVFNNPLKNIPITFNELIILSEHTSTYRHQDYNYYLTNADGVVELKSKYYFGKETDFFSMDVNTDAFKNNNKDFDIKLFEIKAKNNNISVVLAPFKVNYKNCESISNQISKNECFKYSLFYNAINDRNPELCKVYQNGEVKFWNAEEIGSRPGLFFGDEIEVMNECLMLVGILNRDNSVCQYTENVYTRYFKDDCECLVNNSCINSNSKDLSQIRPLLLSDVHNYFCDKNVGGFYKNEIPADLVISSQLYRKIFCQ